MAFAVPPPEPTDEALLARVAVGDMSSFQAFYQRHAGRVLAYARKLDTAFAEDVAQEVFLAVWRKAATFKPDRGEVAGWLYGLTRNKFVDHWRKAGGRIGMEPLDSLPPAGPPGIPAREPESLPFAVRQALARVAPEQRRAIELAYFDGFTYEETAGRLALPLGTLKSRIRAGLKTMRAVLAS
jgi:RNA polymerase sigma-70 factor (ECF subfamily)